MLANFVAVRQIYLFLVTRYISNTAQLVEFGYPVGWTDCCILFSSLEEKTGQGGNRRNNCPLNLASHSSQDQKTANSTKNIIKNYAVRRIQKNYDRILDIFQRRY